MCVLVYADDIVISGNASEDIDAFGKNNTLNSPLKTWELFIISWELRSLSRLLGAFTYVNVSIFLIYLIDVV